MNAGTILRKLPFSEKITKLVPYYREAQFYNNIKNFKEDKELKAAIIRKIAHSLDKDLTAFESLRGNSGELKLEELLQDWKKQGFEKKPKAPAPKTFF